MRLPAELIKFGSLCNGFAAYFSRRIAVLRKNNARHHSIEIIVMQATKSSPAAERLVQRLRGTAAFLVFPAAAAGTGIVAPYLGGGNNTNSIVAT
jgi:hypothetical protein